MSVWMTWPTFCSRLIFASSASMRASVAASTRPRLCASGHSRGCTASAESAHVAGAALAARAKIRRDARPGNSALPQEVAIPRPALLQAALLGGEVDVHQAEAPGVTLGPFEVVHQGPGEIAVDRH